MHICIMYVFEICQTVVYAHTHTEMKIHTKKKPFLNEDM